MSEQLDMFAESPTPEYSDGLIRETSPKGWATFSPCRGYRFELGRHVNADDRTNACVFFMLNPSKAGASENDPTVSRTIEFTRRWGFGCTVVINAWPLIATDPRDMASVPPERRDWNGHGEAFIKRWTEWASRIVVAWGNHPSMKQRGRELYYRYLSEREVLCLNRTGDGSPMHPLARGKAFIPYDVEPQTWRPS